jgi:TetR/AcrR family acrAB operon transcriptional repressor
VTTRRQQTGRESRELILDAAAELFAEKGYRRTTFVDVAERSGVSRGSIRALRQQGGPAAGRARTLDDRVRRRPRRRGRSTDDLDTGFDRLAQGLRALVARPTTRLFTTLLVEALEPDSPTRDRYVEIHAALRDHCARWLARLPLPPGSSPEALAVVLTGAGMGIHQQWLLAPDRVDPEQALTALHALVAALAQPAAPGGWSLARADVIACGGRRGGPAEILR